MRFAAFNAISPAALRALADSLRDGALSKGMSYPTIQQIAGARSDEVARALDALQQQGMTPHQMGILVSAIAETREMIPDPSLVFELVLSGPSLATIPTRHTAAVVRTLFADAQHEVLVAGYAIHGGEAIFGPLHARMLEKPGLAVRLLFDIPRRQDSRPDQDVVESFASEFAAHHWPWPELPELYFYPRSLELEPGERGSLHAKCVIVDARTALITSANFTQAAQLRNIEAGIITRFEPMVRRLRSYLQGLIDAGHVRSALAGQ